MAVGPRRVERGLMHPFTPIRAQQSVAVGLALAAALSGVMWAVIVRLLEFAHRLV